MQNVETALEGPRGDPGVYHLLLCTRVTDETHYTHAHSTSPHSLANQCYTELSMVVHICNLSTQEAEVS